MANYDNYNATHKVAALHPAEEAHFLKFCYNMALAIATAKKGGLADITSTFVSLAEAPLLNEGPWKGLGYKNYAWARAFNLWDLMRQNNAFAADHVSKLNVEIADPNDAGKRNR